MVQTMYTHVCKCERYLLKLFQELGGGMGERSRGGEFKYDIFGALKEPL
jgi:hypothetical protein